MIELNSVIYFYIIPFVLIYLVYRFGIRKYFLDSYRQKMFKLRERLFNLGAEGKIDFDSDVYRAQERQLNIFIRYAHVISLSNVVFTQIAIILGLYKSQDKDPIEEVDLSGVNPNVKSEIDEIITQAHKNTVIYYHLRSPLLLLLVLYIFTKNILINSTKNISSEVSSKAFNLVRKDVGMNNYQDQIKALKGLY